MADIRSKYFPGSSGAISMADLNNKAYYFIFGTGKDAAGIGFLINSKEDNPFDLNTLRGTYYSSPDISIKNTYAYSDYMVSGSNVTPLFTITRPSGLTPTYVNFRVIGGGGAGGVGGIGADCGTWTNWSGGGGGGGGGSGGIVDLYLEYKPAINTIQAYIGDGGEGKSYGDDNSHHNNGYYSALVIKNTLNNKIYEILSCTGSEGSDGKNGVCAISGAGGAAGDTRSGVIIDYRTNPNGIQTDVTYTNNNNTPGSPGVSGSGVSIGGSEGKGAVMYNGDDNYYAGKGGAGSSGKAAYGGFPDKSTPGNPGCIIVTWYYV